jgi:hypothetical protein
MVFLRVAVYSSRLALSALEVCPVCLQAKLLDTDSSATVLTHPQFISREYQPGASPERKHQDCLPSKPARQPGPPPVSIPIPPTPRTTAISSAVLFLSKWLVFAALHRTAAVGGACPGSAAPPQVLE